MTRIERGNVVLDVQDEEVEHYLLLGFNVTDSQGRIIKTSIPTNLGALQAAFVENQAIIADLRNTIAELTEEVERLKAENAKAKKPATKTKKG